MRTAIVILNWNTAGYLEKFLPGVVDSVKGADAEVIVADSASVDGSLEVMREKFPSIRTIPLQENYGFTGGYDRALGELSSEGFGYYILLNSDIEVTQGWLQPLLSFMDSHPECGACAPKLLSYYDHWMFEYAGAAGGLIDTLGYTFCRGRVLSRVERDSGQYDASPAKVFWATGACLVVRAEVWKRLGGLDDRFFAHMEEIDLCWRMQLEGYSVCCVPESTVYHLGGGTLPKTSPLKLKLNYRNNLLLLENNLAKTFALEGLYPKAAVRKARSRIHLRMVLDGISAGVYLLQMKGSYFMAVVNAHREYRSLRRKTTVEDVISFISNAPSTEIAGVFRGWMVPRAIFFPGRFFRKIHSLAGAPKKKER